MCEFFRSKYQVFQIGLLKRLAYEAARSGDFYWWHRQLAGVLRVILFWVLVPEALTSPPKILRAHTKLTFRRF
jgi:hypothetical protein